MSDPAQTLSAWMEAVAEVDFSQQGVRFGAETVKEVLRFLLATCLTGQQEPVQRCMSLPTVTDECWHAMIVHERAYAKLMEILTRVSGTDRPWHEYNPIEDKEHHSRRVLAWKSMEKGLWPTTSVAPKRTSKRKVSSKRKLVDATKWCISVLFGDKTIKVYAKEGWEGIHVMEALERQEGIPVAQQVLLYEGSRVQCIGELDNSMQVMDLLPYSKGC